nr:hypothetical protein REQ54_02303 [Rhizobium sp. Q54]
MALLQTILNGLAWLGSPDGCSWQEDMLRHPDLARMAERELANLPFPRPPRALPESGGREIFLKRCA